MDAILVGIGTALADDPQLTARPPGPRQPARVVLDGAARLPVRSRLAQTARDAPVWVAVTGQAPADRLASLAALGCEILAFPGDGRVPVLPLLAELSRRGVTNLLVEGGGQVLGAFLDAGQVDAVDVYIAPALEGGDAPVQPRPRSRSPDHGRRGSPGLARGHAARRRHPAAGDAARIMARRVPLTRAKTGRYIRSSGHGMDFARTPTLESSSPWGTLDAMPRERSWPPRPWWAGSASTCDNSKPSSARDTRRSPAACWGRR